MRQRRKYDEQLSMPPTTQSPTSTAPTDWSSFSYGHDWRRWDSQYFQDMEDEVTFDKVCYGPSSLQRLIGYRLESSHEHIFFDGHRARRCPLFRGAKVWSSPCDTESMLIHPAPVNRPTSIKPRGDLFTRLCPTSINVVFRKRVEGRNAHIYVSPSHPLSHCSLYDT